MKKSRVEINNQIQEYWKEIKKEKDKTFLNRDPVKKKKVPSFTRHNGSRRAMVEGWRKSKGSKANKLTRPKIGYKNPENIRYRKKNGLKIVIVYHEKELLRNFESRKDYEVYSFARTLGAKKRAELLKLCKERKIPLYFSR